ncbi:uncharacterized protein V6R79_023650 [Siganus canaliculatus]
MCAAAAARRNPARGPPRDKALFTALKTTTAEEHVLRLRRLAEDAYATCECCTFCMFGPSHLPLPGAGRKAEKEGLVNKEKSQQIQTLRQKK